MRMRSALLVLLLTTPAFTLAEIVTVTQEVEVSRTDGPYAGDFPLGRVLEISWTVDTAATDFRSSDPVEGTYFGQPLESSLTDTVTGDRATTVGGLFGVFNDIPATNSDQAFYYQLQPVETLDLQGEDVALQEVGFLDFAKAEMLPDDSIPAAPLDFVEGYVVLEGPSGVSWISVVLVQDLDTDGDGILDEADACPASQLDPSIVFSGVDSGVDNLLQVDGCTLRDEFAAACTSPHGNHGAFVMCIADVSDSLRRAGVLSGREAGAVRRAAAKSTIGRD